MDILIGRLFSIRVATAVPRKYMEVKIMLSMSMWAGTRVKGDGKIA